MTTGPESPVRDAALDATWRAHSLDEPPAQVDAAILAAAQAAVAAGPREARSGAAGAAPPQRWWMPLAAAAMLSAVVIGVSRLLPQEQAATAPFAVGLPERDAAPSGSPLPLEREEGSPRLPELGADVKFSKEAPARGGAARFQASPTSAPPPAGARLPADRLATSVLAADATLARIRELYAAGRLTEAAKQLVALRAALPDADRRLPPELQQWAATVEP